MQTIPIALVSGTWAYKNRFDLDAWWQPASRFAAMLGGQGFDTIEPRPYDSNGRLALRLAGHAAGGCARIWPATPLRV